MAEEKENQEQNANPKPQERGEKQGSNLVLMLSILGGIVVINVVIAILLIKPILGGDEKEEKAEAKADSLKAVAAKQTEIGIISDPPIEVVANIEGENGFRYLKTKVVMEYKRKHESLSEALIKRYKKHKSLLLDILNSLTIKDLKERGVKKRVCQEFKKAVNKTLPDNTGKIQNVYIEEWIIQ
ncbi:MAG: flagellar basal body-associated FliL family protein [Chitinivibrionales bacterium]